MNQLLRYICHLELPDSFSGNRKERPHEQTKICLLRGSTRIRWLLNGSHHTCRKEFKFLPKYIGKMQLYLAILDDYVCMTRENPCRGIILCKIKDGIIAEYTLKKSEKPIC